MIRSGLIVALGALALFALGRAVLVEARSRGTLSDARAEGSSTQSGDPADSDPSQPPDFEAYTRDDLIEIALAAIEYDTRPRPVQAIVPDVLGPHAAWVDEALRRGFVQSYRHGVRITSNGRSWLNRERVGVLEVKPERRGGT